MNNKSFSHLTEQDVYHFLLNAYFGRVEDPLFVAANSAYLDLNRTIEFKKSGSISKEIKEKLRTESVGLIKKEIQGIIKILEPCQIIFDNWHTSLCNAIVKSYTDADIPFHYGQAQKWVNMALKYLSVINRRTTETIQRYLHVPIDSIIIETAEDEFQIDPPVHRWSRMDGPEYVEYQKKLCEAIRKRTGLTPILWEFKKWNR